MKILLHICCANCAVYPVTTLRQEGHSITGFWFNPNIQPYQEYGLRLDSIKALADKWHTDMIYRNEFPDKTPRESQLLTEHYKMKISSVPSSCSGKVYDPAHGDTTAAELPEIPERPARCRSCYRLRLEKTAEEASRQGIDAFSTTLLISPYQDFEQISAIGNLIAEQYGVLFYIRDFRPGFKKSMAIAKELDLYRQKYCGCILSREERRKKTKSKLQINVK